MKQRYDPKLGNRIRTIGYTTILAMGIGISGCQEKSMTQAQPAPGVDSRKVANPQKDSENRLKPPSGFIAEPSPDEVISSLSIGRSDPFASAATDKVTLPLPRIIGGGKALTREEVLSQISGFQITGAIGEGKSTKAIVDYKDNKGYLQAGMEGNRSGLSPTQLLPEGWTVRRVSSKLGMIEIQKYNATVRLFVGSTMEIDISGNS